MAALIYAVTRRVDYTDVLLRYSAMRRRGEELFHYPDTPSHVNCNAVPRTPNTETLFTPIHFSFCYAMFTRVTRVMMR